MSPSARPAFGRDERRRTAPSRTPKNSDGDHVAGRGELADPEDGRREQGPARPPSRGAAAASSRCAASSRSSRAMPPNASGHQPHGGSDAASRRPAATARTTAAGRTAASRSPAAGAPGVAAGPAARSAGRPRRGGVGVAGRLGGGASDISRTSLADRWRPAAVAGRGGRRPVSGERAAGRPGDAEAGDGLLGRADAGGDAHAADGHAGERIGAAGQGGLGRGHAVEVAGGVLRERPHPAPDADLGGGAA